MAEEPDLLDGQENDASWVTYLKQTLQYWGCWDGDTEDGSWDSDVAEAVKKFQREQNLVEDGWVGDRTWTVLKEEGKVIPLDDLPGLKRLADIGEDEDSIKRWIAEVTEVDDADALSRGDE